jgi:hypothetical protein
MGVQIQIPDTLSHLCLHQSGRFEFIVHSLPIDYKPLTENWSQTSRLKEVRPVYAVVSDQNSESD